MSNELPPMPQSQTMSQADMERLLATAEAQGVPDAMPGIPEEKLDEESSQRHEFPQVSAFSASESRTLKARHEEYIRALGSRLSGHLRTECGLQITKFESLRSRPFMEKLANPTHLALFRLEPIGAMCLLEIPPKLALSLVDRELGGPGIFPDDLRELTNMETRLLTRLIDLILAEWCSAWRDAMECKPVLVRHETCGKFVQCHAPDLMLTVLGVEVRIGDLVEPVQLAVPRTVLEALLLKLNRDAENSEKGAKPKAAAPAQWNPGFNNLEMRVSAEWFGLELLAGQLAELKPGDILPVSAGTAARVQILIDSAPKFVGDLGKCGPQWAVKISGKQGA
jgi:flagellar motor switch protein FliM